VVVETYQMVRREVLFAAVSCNRSKKESGGSLLGASWGAIGGMIDFEDSFGPCEIRASSNN
jgi:hypothetical protein